MTSLMWFSIALVLTVTFAFPLYFMVISSFKLDREVLSASTQLIPANFQGLTNYQRAFDVVPLARFFFNSALMAVIDVIVTVFFSALAGYGFAKYRFRGSRIMFLFILITMTVPFQILLVPLFIEVRSFGWDDSYAGLIIPGIMNAFGVFMMRQFAYNIPDELLDAARIDGASEFRIFWRIVFPLLAPASASLAIIIFLFSWNNFLWPLIIIKDQNLAPIQVGITAFTQTHSAEPQWGVAMAVSTLATLPVAVLFVFFQRYFIEGLLMSGIKG
ncbi:MAG: carbohydrate ABC transporter permease [Anaerolineae bacterium]|nr:carbohydrate ABC transporter permease [Anaerolineae bacterium]MBN8618155.1 carbohydrate ABC transporter permease [Anaerolineae bacterium]